MNKLSPVPSRLLVPGNIDSIEPPVMTRVPLLPLGQLSFDNFQRLSVRLLSASNTTVSCQEYGTSGQKQEGIDLYARVAGQTKMEVWQCKRYGEFTANDVKKAVKVFLDGNLVDETSKFVLVTSASTESTQVIQCCFTDIDAATALLQRLEESDSADEWATYPWLLRGGALENVNDKLREWAEQRWKDTCGLDWCVFGFDLFQFESVPLKETLLELLLTNKRYILDVS